MENESHDRRSRTSITEENIRAVKKGEVAPIKAKMLLSAGKILATVFWDSKGIVFVDFLHE